MQDYQREKITSAYLMVIACSFITAGYECLRTTSSALFKSAYGADNFVFAMALVPVVMTVVLVGYNKALGFLGTKNTFFTTTIISQISIGLLYILLVIGYKHSSFILYLVREVYIVLIIEQVWSFLNTILDKSEAKKLYGKFLAVTTIGSLTGDYVVYALAKTWGAKSMIAINCLCFLPALFFAYLAYKKAPKVYQQKTKADKIKGDGLGLELFKKEPTLIIILILVLSSQAYGTFATLNYETILHQKIPDIDEQSSFASMTMGILHIAILFSQAFFSPFIFKKLSLYKIHIMVPFVHFVCLVILFLKPGLPTSIMCFTDFKAFDYSIFKVAKELLYIPLSVEANYKAKEFIDVLGYRCSKGIVSFALAILKKFSVIMSIFRYNMFAFAAVAAWGGALYLFKKQQLIQDKDQSAEETSLK